MSIKDRISNKITKPDSEMSLSVFLRQNTYLFGAWEIGGKNRCKKPKKPSNSIFPTKTPVSVALQGIRGTKNLRLVGKNLLQVNVYAIISVIQFV